MYEGVKEMKNWLDAEGPLNPQALLALRKFTRCVELLVQEVTKDDQ
jgi:hypothetical protein